MKQENGDGAQAVRLSRQMLRRGAALAALFGIGMLAVLLARLYRLQISQHDFYESLALEQQLRETKGAAARGSITDTNGNPLAVSATVENVYLSPMEIEADGEDRELIARGLAESLGVDRETLYEKTGRRKEKLSAYLMNDFELEKLRKELEHGGRILNVQRYLGFAILVNPPPSSNLCISHRKID